MENKCNKIVINQSNLRGFFFYIVLHGCLIYFLYSRVENRDAISENMD